MTDTIDSHTNASGEPPAGAGSGAAAEARTTTATLERPAPGSASGPSSPYPPPAPVPRAGALPTPAEQTQAAKDKTLTSPAAVELAHRALEEITDPITIGEYRAVAPIAERLVTHLFDCTLSGYRGWHWAVTLSRVPRGRTATVCEMELLPGEDALLAPAWIPWADRLEPGDITRSDRLPRKEADERLEPGWEATGEDADAVAVDQLDLGRPRVLSAQGVSSAAERWYGGDHGPDAEGVRKAHATCSTCGFFLPMAGALRAIFGVCANEWATDDGSVVSLDHGCGAHSETDLPDQGPEWPINPSRVDDHLMVPLSTNGLDLREGQTIAELAAQQPADNADQVDDVAGSEDSPDNGPDGATTVPETDASSAEPQDQDVDTAADAAKTAADIAAGSDDAAGATGPHDVNDTESKTDSVSDADADVPATEEQPPEAPSNRAGSAAEKSAAKRSRRATSSAECRRRSVDVPAESDGGRRSHALDFDLEDLGRTTFAAGSASSASSPSDAAGPANPVTTAEALVAAVEPPSAPASAGSGDTPSERAASARAAVAGLSLALGIDPAQDDASADNSHDAEGADAEAEVHRAPRTLAELEAILPNRS